MKIIVKDLRTNTLTAVTGTNYVDMQIIYELEGGWPALNSDLVEATHEEKLLYTGNAMPNTAKVEDFAPEVIGTVQF